MLDPALAKQAFADRIGENLTRLRQAADLSQDDLSYMAGIHRTEISQLERGMRVPRADTLVKLCACLEADYADLLDGLSWKPPRREVGSLEVTRGRS
jgi:transcriptional regulator with XRE-family HTH domain